jgi:hypothetical protein
VGYKGVSPLFHPHKKFFQKKKFYLSLYPTGQRHSSSKLKALHFRYHLLDQIVVNSKMADRVYGAVFDLQQSGVFRGDSKKTRERGFRGMSFY